MLMVRAFPEVCGYGNERINFDTDVKVESKFIA